MGIMDSARAKAFAAIGASAAMASIAMVAPGSALAAEGVCHNPLNGTGSSLQKVQQETWTTEAGKETKLHGECTAKIEIKYAPEGSGAGLGEFGMEAGFKLEPSLGIGKKLDGFIGTDDPPTKAQLVQVTLAVAEHAGSEAVVIAPLSAPIAMIMHLPAGCELQTGAEPAVTQASLEEFWRHKGTSWETMLKSGSAAIKLNGAASCTSATEASKNIDEVRSDKSGTSYAFKQWMCQIAGEGKNEWDKTGEKCEQDSGGKDEYINDSKEWPLVEIEKSVATECIETLNPCSEEHMMGTLRLKNEKGPGEANAVKETPDSVGYANAADAAGEGFEAGGKATLSIFWVKVENETATEKFADPLTSTGAGNCTKANILTTAQETAAKKNEWFTVHLAAGKKVIEGYPACTLTYDVGWKTYTTAELVTAPYYESKGLAEELANATKAYFLWELGSGAKEGQLLIQKFYAEPPESVLEISREDAALI